MRAHFAPEPIYEHHEDSLEEQISDFKNDSEKMEIVVDFVSDVLRLAEIEAGNKLKSQQESSRKPSGQFPVLANLNGRLVNRARGVMVRLFDVICNCANNAAAGPAQQLSSKKLSKN